jgi:hypothetical protein
MLVAVSRVAGVFVSVDDVTMGVFVGMLAHHRRLVSVAMVQIVVPVLMGMLFRSVPVRMRVPLGCMEHDPGQHQEHCCAGCRPDAPIVRGDCG